MKGLFSIDKANVRSAIVYGLLTASVTFFLVMASAILVHGSIFGLDWTNIVDKSALAALGVLVALVSLLKNFLTNEQGKFLGVVEVIPDKV